MAVRDMSRIPTLHEDAAGACTAWSIWRSGCCSYLCRESTTSSSQLTALAPYPVPDGLPGSRSGDQMLHEGDDRLSTAAASQGDEEDRQSSGPPTQQRQHHEQQRVHEHRSVGSEKSPPAVRMLEIEVRAGATVGKRAFRFCRRSPQSWATYASGAYRIRWPASIARQLKSTSEP